MINFITLFDLIYIAGFLDGDGAIIAQFVTRDDYKWKYQIRLSIQFTQHTKRSIYLTKLKQIIGAGSIRHRTVCQSFRKAIDRCEAPVEIGHQSTDPAMHSMTGSGLGVVTNYQTGSTATFQGLSPSLSSFKAPPRSFKGDRPRLVPLKLPQGALKAIDRPGYPFKWVARSVEDFTPVVEKESVSDYVITANLSVLAFLKLIQPYLRIKQKQANLAITILEQLPLAKNDKVKFIELVDMVDHIASLNDTKLTKRTLTGAVVKETLKNVPPIAPNPPAYP